MFRLIMSLALVLPAGGVAERPQRTIPHDDLLTPGGDRLGYAPVDRADLTSYRLTGILAGHDPVAREDVQCGATVIHSRSRSLVLTAAHCLYHGGRPLKELEFLPGFDRGRARLGTWRVARAWVPARWSRHPGATATLPYDVALAGVGKRGRALEQVTGRGLRPATGWRDGGRELELLGYPVGGPYAGTRLYRCVGDASPYRGVLVTRNCHAAGGGSGGPALYGGAVAGVVSSSSPLTDPAGFTVMSRLDSAAFRKLLARADRTMLRRRG
ncbi:hypothetical protein OIE66_29145 [Nonomuraea sp. NBC_01738]|uniref:trypsin-like serine peptidase n=1 Tax=Nonomuraea sp. NBC_01738 TaxID=2976003 RepID=UPI002E128B9F|nr:hypothetical protein OIE66_29145 [Nonomuraea sp. NBC_01738]